MADDVITVIPGKPGQRIRLDADAFGRIFASFAQHVPTVDVLYGYAVVPDTLDALPMRKNADGVFVFDKRVRNTYVTDEEAAAYPRDWHGDFIRITPPKRYR